VVDFFHAQVIFIEVYDTFLEVARSIVEYNENSQRELVCSGVRCGHHLKRSEFGEEMDLEMK